MVYINNIVARTFDKTRMKFIIKEKNYYRTEKQRKDMESILMKCVRSILLGLSNGCDMYLCDCCEQQNMFSGYSDGIYDICNKCANEYLYGEDYSKMKDERCDTFNQL